MERCGFHIIPNREVSAVKLQNKPFVVRSLYFYIQKSRELGFFKVYLFILLFLKRCYFGDKH